MISQFFVLSPRGDTILAKQYRSTGSIGAHERSHTEAFFRKIKFWQDTDDSEKPMLSPSELQSQANTETAPQQHGDAPPVFKMPDGQTYFHVRRNGLLFAASSQRNVSPNTVLEVRKWKR